MIISVEGNIGASKTTFLDIVQQALPDIEIIQEPVDVWKNFEGHNVLQAYYDNPAETSFMFQGLALLTRLEAQLRPQTANIRIVERSGLSDYCFAKNCFEAGLMTQMEFDVYCGWYRLASKIVPKVDMVIYLRTSPQVCHERIKRRLRAEETCIPIEYLEGLHRVHDDRFLATSVVIDRDQDILGDEETKKAMIAKVKLAISRATSGV